MDPRQMFAMLAGAEAEGFRKGCFVGGVSVGMIFLMLVVTALVISHRHDKS